MVVRIRGILVNDEPYVKIAVESEEELVKVAQWLDLPIIENEEYAAVADPAKRIIYIYYRSEKR